MLDKLPTSYAHEGAVSGLDKLLAQKNSLIQQFQHFLIFCKVEGFAPKTIQNYAKVLTPFLTFCENELGIDDTSATGSAK